MENLDISWGCPYSLRDLCHTSYYHCHQGRRSTELEGRCSFPNYCPSSDNEFCGSEIRRGWDGYPKVSAYLLCEWKCQVLMPSP